MNKQYKIIIYAAAILMFISAAYNYFNVKGNEIKKVSEISPECSVSIVKSYHLVEGEQNYTLDSEQIDRLKSLISNSSFTRVLSSTVRFYDKDIYTIKIDFNNTASATNLFLLLISLMENTLKLKILNGKISLKRS